MASAIRPLFWVILYVTVLAIQVPLLCFTVAVPATASPADEHGSSPVLSTVASVTSSIEGFKLKLEALRAQAGTRPDLPFKATHAVLDDCKEQMFIAEHHLSSISHAVSHQTPVSSASATSLSSLPPLPSSAFPFRLAVARTQFWDCAYALGRLSPNPSPIQAAGASAGDAVTRFAAHQAAAEGTIASLSSSASTLLSAIQASHPPHAAAAVVPRRRARSSRSLRNVGSAQTPQQLQLLQQQRRSTRRLMGSSAAGAQQFPVRLLGGSGGLVSRSEGNRGFPGRGVKSGIPAWLEEGLYERLKELQASMGRGKKEREEGRKEEGREKGERGGKEREGGAKPGEKRWADRGEGHLQDGETGDVPIPDKERHACRANCHEQEGAGQASAGRHQEGGETEDVPLPDNDWDTKEPRGCSEGGGELLSAECRDWSDVDEDKGIDMVTNRPADGATSPCEVQLASGCNGVSNGTDAAASSSCKVQGFGVSRRTAKACREKDTEEEVTQKGVTEEEVTAESGVFWRRRRLRDSPPSSSSPSHYSPSSSSHHHHHGNGSRSGGGSSPSPSSSSGGKPVVPNMSIDVTVGNQAGDTGNLEDAIAAAPGNRRFVIFLRPGTYNGNFTIATPGVVLLGAGSDNTVISGRLSNSSGATTFRSCTLCINAPNVAFLGVRIENTAGLSGNQAVALRVSGDQVVGYESTIAGFQDTAYLHSGRVFLKDCHVIGSVDFIFGDSAAVLYSPLISVTGGKSIQTITASSRSANTPTGIVIVKGVVEADNSTTELYLGRPWHECSQTVFIDTYLPRQLNADGWATWNGDPWGSCVFYAESNSSGPGALTSRASWVHPAFISSNEAQAFQAQQFLNLSSWFNDGQNQLLF